MRIRNPFRKRRTVQSFTPPKKRYKNPFFKKENFSDILFRTLKIHYGFIILILIGFAYLFFYSEIFQINMVEVKGAVKASNTEIEKLVKDKMTQSRFLIFSQNNYFFFNEKKARQEIRAEIESKIALEKFVFEKKFPRKIYISLKEVTPSITWLSGGSYYYIDKNGTVAQGIPLEEINQDFPLIEDINNLPIKPQEKIISQTLLASIPKIKKNLSEIGLEIDRFYTPDIFCLSQVIKEPEEEEDSNINLNENTNAAIEIEEVNSNENSNSNTNSSIEECDLKARLQNNTELHVGIKEAYKIFYDTSRDISEQTKNLDLMLRTKLKGKTNLQYIDLRFENRVYYK